MPISVEFLDQSSRILRYDVSDPLLWDEVARIAERGRELARLHQHRVDVIVDATKLLGVPTEVFTHLAHIYQLRSPNIGIIVFVSNNAFFNVLRRVGMRVFPHLNDTYFIAASVEEAQAMIEAQYLN
jgi:hypothetical protein